MRPTFFYIHAWVGRMAASYNGDREQGSLLQYRRICKPGVPTFSSLGLYCW